MRVALFITCITDTLYPQTGRAVVALLRRLGCEVDFPERQTCCGQMHLNTGYRDEAVRLARRTKRVFGKSEIVVVPSGSCAAMIREHYPRLGAEMPRVVELTEFLVDVLGVTDVGAYFPHRVTYHPTCHSLRGLGLGGRPETLLRAVRGLELVPLPRADECCGFGGTFAVKNPAVSAAMCADKVGAVLDTGAEVLCAADNSCLTHLGGALRRQRTGVRVMHIAEILASTESGGAGRTAGLSTPEGAR
ncbi:L-lactate dehydrogenase complex protein LldE [Sinosporangium album]|uniref:L-lactate dehydrogenase complex protein LldE n=1 Tax=Sinosporangium album TaxID=504805 RepID=A0A1G7T5N4_9ACTN|nr:(Fe-S)-binding protein [Sinosporangium album]SDG30541.1 L-lactate dehydrogenase complex protein LldE [Sinosporangium album]